MLSQLIAVRLHYLPLYTKCNSFCVLSETLASIRRYRRKVKQIFLRGQIGKQNLMHIKALSVYFISTC